MKLQKINNLEELEIFNDSGVEEEINPPESLKSDNLDLDVETITLESGREALKFISPITDKEIIILFPTTLDLLNIERTIVKKHKDAGNFEQLLVSLSKLIVKYGDSQGENVVSFYKLSTFSPKEISIMGEVCANFFR